MSRMKQIRAVIFDLDGTLLNTLDDLADSMNHVLEEFGYPARTLVEIRKFVGNGVRKLVERSMGYPDDKVYTEEERSNVDQVFDRMRAYYAEHSNEKTAPYAGVTECLEQLQQKGILTAIVSNKLDGAVKELNEIYFQKWVTEAIGELPGVTRKPAPDMLELVMGHLGVTKEECVYVGDSEVDIETAVNAGIPCIAVTWGFRDVDLLKECGAGVMIDQPEELISVIDVWNNFRSKEYQYLLFDLDGTLTNPEEGITKSVQYSLKEEFGIEAERKDLLRFIGPPLWDSFKDFYGLSKDEADRAVTKYRERYLPIGVYENYPYEGMWELLRDLKSLGYHLGVATSKPEVMAQKVLDKFDMSQWFDVITGSELDGHRVKKSDVIEETMMRFGNPERSRVLMIGDRLHDIEGAKEAGMDSCGVYYGFAEPGEMEKHGAHYIIQTVRELRSLLCGK